MTIDLSHTDPRNYLVEVERALTLANYIAVAKALHSAHPRDLAEVWVLLPDDVEIKLYTEATDATANH